MSDEIDDDAPQLSAETCAALQEFYEERQLRKTLETSEITFDENWQLSQFWYNGNTIKSLVQIAVKTLGPTGKIALISCPTLYKPMRNELAPTCKNFIFYDYNSPEKIPQDRSGYYDLVIADPPFLSEECLTKTAKTMKLICDEKMILCTGAVMEELAYALLDLKKCKFEPQHRNNLANEFRCFSNYDVDSLLHDTIQ